MLSRLIGYEMKAFGRILLPIYAAIVVAAVLLGIDFRFFPNSAGSAGTIALTVILGVLAAAVSIVTVLLLVIRFYNNLLGREGYLMFSIPTGTGNLIWAKVISSVIWSIFSVIISAVVMAPFLIAADYSGETEKIGVGQMMSGFFKAIEPYKMNILLGILLVIALAVFAITRLYASMAIGQLWTEHRILGSVLAFIATGILETVLVLSSGNGLFTVVGNQNLESALDAAKYESIFLAVTAAGIAVYGAVTWLILDRKLNLE
jgi:hypothetical protein